MPKNDMHFQNPVNGYIETISNPRLATFLRSVLLCREGYMGACRSLGCACRIHVWDIVAALLALRAYDNQEALFAPGWVEVDWPTQPKVTTPSMADQRQARYVPRPTNGI